mmetsp:Transcript_357/g.311  ORF Transcript_357/g.311 Transcript_357/m.311 type:complete len:81 (+) Transcript_357:627-869(+)
MTPTISTTTNSTKLSTTISPNKSPVRFISKSTILLTAAVGPNSNAVTNYDGSKIIGYSNSISKSYYILITGLISTNYQIL